MRLIAGLATFCFAVLGGALWAPAATAAPSAQVTMANYAFAPASLTVSVGDTVTWTNTDQAPHDVTTTSAPVSVHSSMLSKGQSWSYTFSTPGTYAYICSIHPDMKASVVVRPRATPVTTTAAAAPRTSVTTLSPVNRVIAGKPSARGHRASRPSAAPVAVTPTTPTTTNPAAQATPQSAPPAPSLRPLLLVTGLVAAVATFCLLLLASRPEHPEGAG